MKSRTEPALQQQQNDRQQTTEFMPYKFKMKKRCKWVEGIRPIL